MLSFIPLLLSSLSFFPSLSLWFCPVRLLAAVLSGIIICTSMLFSWLREAALDELDAQDDEADAEEVGFIFRHISVVHAHFVKYLPFVVYLQLISSSSTSVLCISV